MTVDYIKEATFVVPPAEIDIYTRRLAQLEGKFNVVACNMEGIAKTRRWIGKYADIKGESTFLMLDDDLSFFVRKSDEVYNLQISVDKDIKEMLKWTADQFKDKTVAHVSMSVRQGNNTGPVGSVANTTRRNTRTLRYLAYRTDQFLAMKHNRVPVMEDFDVNLQLLRAGYDNILSYYWSQDQAASGMPGGCSSYRSLGVHNAAAEMLAQLHAPFVVLRDKVNKSGPVEFRNRREVTIYWQKARASAQRETVE